MFRSISALAIVSYCLFPLSARAQVLDDIDNVHPSWTLSQLRPAAWHVQVGGMAFLPNGKLLILEHVDPGENHTGVPTAKGKLWVVDNPTASGEAIQYHQLASGLKEPVGIMVLNGKVIITEKTMLTEWTLDAGVTTATMTRKIADIPHDKSGDVNFQEYAFGVLYKDGYFYVAGGGAVKGGGKSFDDSPTSLDQEKVGAMLKIKDSDGSITMVNGGMRASNGIAWGPDSSLWMTDNQGSYRPASEFTAVVEGANYGYFCKTNAFSSKPVTPPSIWMIHGEIGRSPTYPRLMAHGIYAGQFLMGDLSQGGIKRAFVEKVDGAWQGAVFSFSGGLEVGIEDILEDDQGVLYVGGLGKGDVNNWGWNAKLFGLQKLTPKAGSTTFEILAIRSRKTGMEIEFTKPVGAGADVAGSYSVVAGEMNPQSGYGLGSMENKKTLNITAVTVSPDKRKVFLELAGLTAKRALTIKTLGVKSETGETPRCPAGWYTLNAISQTDPFATTGLVQKNPALASASAIRLHATRGGVNVSLPFDGNHSLSLRTLQGRQVAERTGNGPKDYFFSGSTLPSGLYLLEVKAGGFTFRNKVAF